MFTLSQQVRVVVENYLFEEKQLIDQKIFKTADWVIDLGPEGGTGGGYVISEGTPEQVSKNKKSYTGKFLKNKLN